MTIPQAELLARVIKSRLDYDLALRDNDIQRVGRDQVEVYGLQIRVARKLELLGLIEVWQTEDTRNIFCRLIDFTRKDWKPL